MNPMMLTSNSIGVTTLQLQQGPDYDSYKMNISVNIVDDNDARTAYYIPFPVYVYPDVAVYRAVLAQIANKDPTSQIYKNLESRNPNIAGPSLLAVGSAINNMPSISSLTNPGAAAAQNSMIEKTRGKMLEVIDGIQADSLDSVKILGSALSMIVSTTDKLADSSIVIFSLHFSFFRYIRT